MKIHPAVMCGYLCLLALTFYATRNIYWGHYEKDGQLYKALHIFLPGYVTICYPEQTVDLKKWVGTKWDSLVANNPDGTENAEATAGLALKAMGLFGDYEFKEVGGHIVLYRPKCTEKRFSMNARYRIGKGKPVAPHKEP